MYDMAFLGRFKAIIWFFNIFLLVLRKSRGEGQKKRLILAVQIQKKRIGFDTAYLFSTYCISYSIYYNTTNYMSENYYDKYCSRISQNNYITIRCSCQHFFIYYLNFLRMIKFFLLLHLYIHF